MTIQDLLKKADSHWDDADVLIDIGTELESRTRLPEARRILERALGLAPKDFPRPMQRSHSLISVIMHQQRKKVKWH